MSTPCWANSSFNLVNMEINKLGLSVFFEPHFEQNNRQNNRWRGKALPGQKELRKLSDPEMVLVIDVMESSIERPTKGQKGFYSGKSKKHVLKTQVIIELKTRKIMCLRHGKGRIHDFKLFKKTKVKITKTIKMLGDKGYQGILKIHENSEPARSWWFPP